MSEGDFEELMEEVLLAANEDELTRLLLGRFDVPAYVRRGIRLEATLGRLYQRLATRRNEFLEGVRVALRLLAQTVTSLEELRSYLRDDSQFQNLRGLYLQHEPDVRWASRTARPARVMATLRALADSIRRFNRLWVKELHSTDLTEVNQEIDQYNRFYLLEKECAMRSPRLAARGFRPVPPVTVDALLERFPTLPELWF